MFDPLNTACFSVSLFLPVTAPLLCPLSAFLPTAVELLGTSAVSERKRQPSKPSLDQAASQTKRRVVLAFLAEE